MSRGRLLIGVIVALFSIISYYAAREDNPITGESQSVGFTEDQELALGQEAAQGLVGAVAVGTSDGTGVGGGQIAQFVAQMTLMKYGREDELQSDSLGVRFMSDAGYDPRAMIDVMDILADASGGSRQPASPSSRARTRIRATGRL